MTPSPNLICGCDDPAVQYIRAVSYKFVNELRTPANQNLWSSIQVCPAVANPLRPNAVGVSVVIQKASLDGTFCAQYITAISDLPATPEAVESAVSHGISELRYWHANEGGS